MAANAVSQEVLDRAIYHFNWNLERILQCLDQIGEEMVWQRPNGVSNSIGNQILHLCGNIGQYIVSSLGQQPDVRQRSIEFSTQDGFPKAALASRIREVTAAAIQIMETVSDAELLRRRKVQAFNYTGIAIVIHATEHYSYHTGQIIFWSKQLLAHDFDFYSGIALE